MSKTGTGCVELYWNNKYLLISAYIIAVLNVIYYMFEKRHRLTELQYIQRVCEINNYDGKLIIVSGIMFVYDIITRNDLQNK